MPLGLGSLAALGPASHLCFCSCSWHFQKRGQGQGNKNRLLFRVYILWASNQRSDFALWIGCFSDLDHIGLTFSVLIRKSKRTVK